jgi:hypothetical protein
MPSAEDSTLVCTHRGCGPGLAEPTIAALLSTVTSRYIRELDAAWTPLTWCSWGDLMPLDQKRRKTEKLHVRLYSAPGQ